MTCLSDTKILLVALATLVAAGCGSAESTDPPLPPTEDNPSEPPPEGALEGRLTGAASGIEYETDTIQRVTGSHGEFYYEPGQVVRFWIGDTYLGATVGVPVVSPFELSGTEPLTTGVRGLRTHRLDIALVGNVLSFLETFDHDGNAENGIQISAETRHLFGGVEVDFRQYSSRFRHDPVFRGALNAANDAEIFADYRAPRPPAEAMERLYDELGLDSRLYAPSSQENDDDADGSIDYVAVTEYDDAGFITRHWAGAPGSPGSITERVKDGWGDDVSSFVQDHVTGAIESSTTANNIPHVNVQFS